jgi:hypothetical protein
MKRLARKNTQLVWNFIDAAGCIHESFRRLYRAKWSLLFACFVVYLTTLEELHRFCSEWHYALRIQHLISLFQCT